MATTNQICNQYVIAIQPDPTNPHHLEYIPLNYVDQITLVQATQTQTHQIYQYQLNVQQQLQQLQLSYFLLQNQQLQQPQVLTTAYYPYAPATVYQNTANVQQITHVLQPQQLQHLQLQQTSAQNRTVFEPSSLSLDIGSLQTICEEKEIKFPIQISPVPSSASSAPSTPLNQPLSPSISPISCVSPSPPTHRLSKKRIKCKKLFVAKYPHRAQLNVYIPKEITNVLLDVVLEEFPTPQSLYYYMDISTALQLNDAQMYRFEVDDEEIVFVNYDLHTKDTRDPIYGVIGLNNGHDGKKDKWRWKLMAFKTALDIYQEYGVCHNELPSSSRRMNYFVKQFETQRNPVIDSKVIDATDWSNVRQIKSLRRKKGKMTRYSEMNIVMRVDRRFFIRQCKESWDAAPVIPIVVNGGKCNQHWIEWVKVIQFRNNERIGISCKYIEEYDDWMITSICLDKGDLENKHRLLGSITSKDDKKVSVTYLDNFNVTFTEIQWIKPHYYY